MLTLNDEIYLRVKRSFYREGNESHLIYMPMATICGNSYFQWFDDAMDMNLNLFNTLVVLNTEDFNRLESKKCLQLKNKVSQCLLKKIPYTETFNSINDILKAFEINALPNPENCFIGEKDLLLSSDSNFEKKLRSEYRKWLYAINFRDVPDVDDSPITLKEFFRFSEFLDLPYNLN